MPDTKIDPVAGIPPGAYLVFNQTIFPLSLPVTHIGRKPENDLVIQDISVSRFHAQIRVEKGNFVLHDLNSHNGTIVNQTKVSDLVLKPGTLVYFGNVMVVFVQEDRRVTENLEQDTGELAHQ
ncbi:MAG: FHA domain-containing protein [Anaerolineae bacterium]|nr:FHA domain-containing protein [Anaerolineae bacterium]